MTRRILLPPLTEVGPGAFAQLPFLLGLLGVKRPFVILDPGLPVSFKADLQGGLLAGLVPLVVEAPAGEPTTGSADEYANQAVSGACDGVVAVGGGSVMDLGKAVSMLAVHDGHANQYQGPDLVQGKGLSVVCVPTTAGSGAEATKSAVLTNTEAQVKRGINAVGVLPDAVILDPELLLSLPSRPRIAALLDATTHALESYIGRNAWQTSDMLASSAFPHLGEHLRFQGDTLTLAAAESALLGSFFAGAAICNAETGAVHALAYPLTEYHGIPHAYAVAALLPSVMRIQAGYCEDRLEEAAGRMGFESGAVFLRRVTHLRENLGIVDQVRQIVEQDDAFARIVQRAMALAGALDNSPMAWSEIDAHAAYELIGE
jgi:alcohol dehydrogenase class IV